MKKKFKMENLDCANCAAKMETAINKIDGVKEATVSFMTQRLVIEADDDRFDEIVKQAAAACKKVDADCEVLIQRKNRQSVWKGSRPKRACCFSMEISFTFPFRGMGFVVNCLYEKLRFTEKAEQTAIKAKAEEIPKMHIFSKEENHGEGL